MVPHFRGTKCQAPTATQMARSEAEKLIYSAFLLMCAESRLPLPAPRRWEECEIQFELWSAATTEARADGSE